MNLFSFLTLTEDAIVHLCNNINKFKIFYEYDFDTDILYTCFVNLEIRVIN